MNQSDLDGVQATNRSPLTDTTGGWTLCMICESKSVDRRMLGSDYVSVVTLYTFEYFM